MDDLLRLHGCRREWCNAYEHWQNYLAERYIGIYKTGARIMAGTAGMPYFLWGEAILHSIDVTNDLPSAGNDIRPQARLQRDDALGLLRCHHPPCWSFDGQAYGDAGYTRHLRGVCPA